jgi:photosystem II stability/assembly factor-like uncharacterized protein
MTHRRLARAAVLLSLSAAVLHGGALAHDAGIDNGVFRSRDGGATWLQVNPESFARGALALAVHPNDPHHLLLGTDSGLSSSRNGGRDWEIEAANLLSGPVFAVAFDADGTQALASGANALYRSDGQRWRQARTPTGSTPARVLVSGGVAGRAYLAGWSGLHRTEDWGRNWARVDDGIEAEHVNALAISAYHPDEIHALAGGRVWSSTDGARHWRVDEGAPAGVDALAFDRTVRSRLWIVAAGRAYRKDDRAAPWEPLGAPIPDAQAKPRGIHVSHGAMLLATDRGVFRSDDAGASWALLSAELPNHSDAALLLRDPQSPATVYAAFSRIGPEQIKGSSLSPEPAFARSDIALLVGAYGGFAMLLLGVGVVVRRFTRPSNANTADPSIDMQAESSS